MDVQTPSYEVSPVWEFASIAIFAVIKWLIRLINVMRLTAIGYILLLALCSCTLKRPYNVPGCSDVWNGKFYIVKGGETTLEILRKGDVQIERTNDGGEHKYKVQWLDSCRYRLTQVPDKPLQASEPKSAVVQITAVTKISYKIEGWLENKTLDTYSVEIFRAPD